MTTDGPTYLYRFYTDMFDLLYVGITSSLVDRFEQHMKAKDWWSDVRHIDIARYPTRDEAIVAEKAAIRDERPIHNVQFGTAPPASVRMPNRSRVICSPADLAFIKDTLSLSAQQLADLFGVTRQAVSKWLVKGVPESRAWEITRAANVVEASARATTGTLSHDIRRPITTDGRSALDVARSSDNGLSVLLRMLTVAAA